MGKAGFVTPLSYDAVTKAIFGTGLSNFGGLKSNSAPSQLFGEAVFTGPWPAGAKIKVSLIESLRNGSTAYIYVPVSSISITRDRAPNTFTVSYTSNSTTIRGDSIYTSWIKVTDGGSNNYGFEVSTLDFNYKMALGCSAWFMAATSLRDAGVGGLEAFSLFANALDSLVSNALPFLSESEKRKILGNLALEGKIAGDGADLIKIFDVAATGNKMDVTEELANTAVSHIEGAISTATDKNTGNVIATFELTGQQSIDLYNEIVADGHNNANTVSSCSGSVPNTPTQSTFGSTLPPVLDLSSDSSARSNFSGGSGDGQGLAPQNSFNSNSQTWAESTSPIGSDTFANYLNEGGIGTRISGSATIQISCKLTGMAITNDGNTWWYQVAQSPWNNQYYTPADNFYNNGQTSGSLHGTPYVDPTVPTCGSAPAVTPPVVDITPAAKTWSEATSPIGSDTFANAANESGKWTRIGGSTTVQITCKLIGMAMTNDGNNWWYQVAQSPWNNQYYTPADNFYNNGQTSGSLHGTPYVDSSVPTCGSTPTPTPTSNSTPSSQTWSEATSSIGSDTFANAANEGGKWTRIGGSTTIQVTCKLTGMAMTNDGNNWWYQVAQSPWNNQYYTPADNFYNNGQTSGSLHGTPYVDLSVPTCGSTPPPTPTPPPPPPTWRETAGSDAHTWTNYSNAGGSEGTLIYSNQSVDIACKVTGFRVKNGNTWWYRIAQAPWSNQFFVSADAFYNNGATSGSLAGTPWVDPAVPNC